MVGTTNGLISSYPFTDVSYPGSSTGMGGG
jgi:hypothetical protein